MSKAKFKTRTKTWLVVNEMSLTDLAKRIGRRRDTVSKAINQGKFPKVRSQIMEVIS